MKEPWSQNLQFRLESSSVLYNRNILVGRLEDIGVYLKKSKDIGVINGGKGAPGQIGF